MRVFVTGITGTLGTALTNLHYERGDQIWGCARNESRAVEWLREHGKKATLFLTSASALGYDDTDIGRLLPSMDRVYHCAAMKHVDLCEEQPWAAHAENVTLVHIVTVACNKVGVPLVHISSDKACLPQSVYGATKLLGEKIALKYGASVVRLGNLVGSSGSVFERWKRSIDQSVDIELTDPDMTRYFIGVADAAKFIADEHEEGVISIPHMYSARMGTIANHIKGTSGCEIKVVGMRPGETLHQWLIAPGDKAYKTGRKCVIKDSPIAAILQNGLSSDKAERWDTEALLKVAGVL